MKWKTINPINKLCKMFIKWNICKVENHEKHGFSFAQEKWSEMIKSKDFIAQAGGWDLNNKNEACIISFWENKESLDNFMKNTHDTIFNNTKQVETYSSIEVKYFDSFIENRDNYELLKEGIYGAKFLNVKTLKASKDEFESFKKTKINHSTVIIRKELKETESNNFEYLISTFCKRFENNNSHLQPNINQILERQILLVDSWKIVNVLNYN